MPKFNVSKFTAIQTNHYSYYFSISDIVTSSEECSMKFQN